MGGIVKNALGVLGGKSSAPSININRKFSTPFSNLRSGALELDPSIRALQEDFLGGLDTTRGIRDSVLNLRGESRGIRSGIGDLRGASRSLRGDLSGLRSSVGANRDALLGNRQNFINARLNPLRANLAQRRGALDRDLGRTGVRGTFGNQARTNLAIDSGRSLQDAEAFALDEALRQEAAFADQESGLVGQEAGLVDQEAGLLEQESGQLGQEAAFNQLGAQLDEAIKTGQLNVSDRRFAQEMQSLGLGVDSISRLLGLSVQSAGLKDQASRAGFSAFGSALGGIGRGIGAAL